MSLIRSDAEIVRGAVPLDPPAHPERVGPSAGRIVAAVVLAALGLLLGTIAGIVLIFATGLVEFC